MSKLKIDQGELAHEICGLEAKNMPTKFDFLKKSNAAVKPFRAGSGYLRPEGLGLRLQRNRG
jgi:hypothetical protein